MGIFTSSVRCAAPVRMFARRDANKQFFAYETSYSSSGTTSLIIPVPVIPEERDFAVSFVNFKSYRNFFLDLDRTFPRKNRNDAVVKPRQVRELVDPLDIVYLPRFTDFGGINARFTLGNEFWSQLPQYHDCGFVVVILDDTYDAVKGVLPFAFEFKTRLRNNLLYFPTIQITKRALDKHVAYDHELFYQGGKKSISDYQSMHSVDESMDLKRAKNALVAGLAYKRHLYGKYPNSDVSI